LKVLLIVSPRFTGGDHSELAKDACVEEELVGVGPTGWQQEREGQ